ncbi:MAG TPA: zinc-binding alcohol dehydrogenase family protein [Acetobacteraceae bacterium]|nr:zinc-binding alcohol dehydrogenase family protein [Acetobacteraceae bacterium]
MKAVAYTHARPVDHEDALLDVELPDPVPRHRDILVQVKAVSVNPVDTKLRRHADPVGEPRVLGFDAAGVVSAIGPEVTLFGVGDAVWYAGSIARPGSDAELQLVDERIVGRKPASLSFAEAAALPLTTITAWEMLFDRLRIPLSPHRESTLLIIGGAGGVGSIAIQLARQLTGVSVIATASRPETREWCRSLGAHEVIDHTADLPAELRRVGVAGAEYIFSTNATDLHWKAIAEAVAAQGKIGVIDDPEAIDVRTLKQKSASFHWELMFTRPVFATPDMIEQHRLLEAVAQLVEQGRIRTTLTEHFGRIDARNLRRAHALIESGRARGKIVLEGF